MNILASLVNKPVMLLVTGGFLVILGLSFLGWFLPQAILHWVKLSGLLRRMRAVTRKNAIAEFREIFSKDKRLSHLWQEYQESLHVQHRFEGGQSVVSAVRATVPAELYFNGQFVVDTRLGTEFFKHLPGIFTGIGIIGTFSGLIKGLDAFQVSENAVVARNSLESLMHSVGEAFLVSAAAIGSAMVVTLCERLLAAVLYKLTEEMAHVIDAQFESGVGEEYLSELVKSSGESAAQSRILKDALVKELGELLRELTQNQISAAQQQQAQLIGRVEQSSREQVEATREDNRELGQTIAQSIQDSLREPLDKIATSVKAASGDQSQAAISMLQDVMTSFSQKLNDLFGGQIAGINELNQKASQNIQEAVSTLQTLVASMESSSQRSADAMAQRMAEAVERMEARQSAMDAQSAAFVEQIRALVASSQSESSQKLHESLESIGSEVGRMLAALADSQKEVFELSQARELAMSSRTEQAVGAMSGSVESVVRELGAATTKMAQSVEMLSKAFTTSIDRMNAGAELLTTASQRFASAGEGVNKALGQAAGLAGKLTEASGQLTSGASAIQDLLRDYRAQRDSVGQLMTELRATVEAARKDASITSDILRRIESSAQKLSEAQEQADTYLEGVSKVLGDAHSTFAAQVVNTLDKSNKAFHEKLSSAVGMVSSSIDEFSVALATLSSPSSKQA
ncbi:MAG: anti-phage ZorAB system protein ZorA [Rhodocyclaceae bacterium]